MIARIAPTESKVKSGASIFGVERGTCADATSMAASIDSLALVSVELIACLWKKTLIYSIDVTLSLFSSGVAASLFQGQQVDDGWTEGGASFYKRNGEKPAPDRNRALAGRSHGRP